MAEKIYGISRIFRAVESWPTPDIVTRLQWWLNAGVDTIIAIVSDKEDKVGTDETLRKAFTHEQVVVVRSTVFDHAQAWSPALNQGLDIINSIARNTNPYVLPFSFTFQVSKDTINSMLFSHDMDTGIVGVKFPGFDAPSYQHPRNTCALYRLNDILAIHGWDKWCDTQGGQEDLDATLRLMSIGKKAKMVTSNDHLEHSPIYNPQQKQDREYIAIKKIAQRFAEKRGMSISEVEKWFHSNLEWDIPHTNLSYFAKAV